MGKADKGKRSSTSRTILEYVILAVVAIAVALLIQQFLVKPYRIPSASMEDTLLIGDRVLVDRISWRFSEPAARRHRGVPPAVRRSRAHQAHHRHAR